MLVEVRVARRGPRLASLNRREKHKSQRRIGPRGVISSATSAPLPSAGGNGRDQQAGDLGRASGPRSENEQGAGGAPGPSGDMAHGETQTRNTRVEVRVTPVRTGVRFSPPPPSCPRLGRGFFRGGKMGTGGAGGTGGTGGGRETWGQKNGGAGAPPRGGEEDYFLAFFSLGGSQATMRHMEDSISMPRSGKHPM